MSKKKNRLSSYEAEEVSIVKRGANKKKFLLFKSEEGIEMDQILENILKSKFENEDELVKTLDTMIPEEVKKSDDYKNVQNTLKGTVRLLKTLDGKINKDSLKTLSELIFKTQETKTPVEGKMEENKNPVKSQEAEAIFKQNKELIAKNEELVKKFEDQDKIRIQKEFDEKAEGFKNMPGEKSDLSMVLKEASEKLDSKTYDKLETILKSADKVMETSEILKEAGSNAAGEVGAWTKIEKAADDIIKGGAKLTHAQAVDLVLKQNPALYDEYNKETEA